MIGIGRDRFFRVAIIYALMIVYSSLLIGPIGIHFVPIGLDRAWHAFLSMPLAKHGSDQRADWTANLLMLIPLGYFVTAAAAPGNGRRGNRLASCMALLACFLFILAVKFAQLYFPPRTVTLNYIMAQTIGAFLGSVVFWLSHKRWGPLLVWAMKRGDGLAILLGLYSLLMIFYFLTPFDFVLSQGDLIDRLVQLPLVVFDAPGPGKPLSFRVLVIVANALSMVPVGMYLAVTGRNKTMRALVFRGFRLMLAVFIVTLFVMGASPYLLALAYRTAGICLGVWLMFRLRGRDLRRWHYRASRMVPLMFVVYCILLIFVSGLVTSQWRTIAEAIVAFDSRGFLPFWHFYIVSKARGATSLVIHLFLFAPIGILIWLRRGLWTKGAVVSAILALFLSLAMEIGRWMKPGLQPDFSDPIIAATGAAFAFKLMPYLFQLLEREATMGASPTTRASRFHDVGAGSGRAGSKA